MCLSSVKMAEGLGLHSIAKKPHHGKVKRRDGLS
jgi:hypothetical protein